MNLELKEAIEEYEQYLGKIIKREIPLRDPSICVVHLQKDNFSEQYQEIIFLLKRLKQNHSNWYYKVLNVEKLIFNILKELRYLEKQKFVLNCSRDDLRKDLKGSTKAELIKKIKDEIITAKNKTDPEAGPSFLILLNINSNYNYIQTKDIISEIINQKGVYIIILYLQKEKIRKEGNEPYKSGDYNVETYYLLKNK